MSFVLMSRMFLFVLSGYSKTSVVYCCISTGFEVRS